MNKKEILGKIIELLLADDYFSGFKYRKKDYRLIKKDSQGFYSIGFQFWDSYDLKRDQVAMIVIPAYRRRFDILHKWFEKFSFRTLADQRDSNTIGFIGRMLERQNDFFFLYSECDFMNDFESMRSEILINAANVFKQFATLQDLYQYWITPVLNGEEELPGGGADWAFEYLTLCRIVNPEKYDDLKKIVLERVQFLNDVRRDPNITEYYHRLGEILEYLESLKLT
jgi:hypothetical protein